MGEEKIFTIDKPGRLTGAYYYLHDASQSPNRGYADREPKSYKNNFRMKNGLLFIYGAVEFSFEDLVGNDQKVESVIYTRRLPNNKKGEIDFNRSENGDYFTNTSCPKCQFSSIYFKQVTLAPLEYPVKVENIRVSITANTTQANIYIKAIGVTGLKSKETVKVNYLVVGKYKS